MPPPARLAGFLPFPFLLILCRIFQKGGLKAESIIRAADIFAGNNRDTDVDNRLVDTVGNKRVGRTGRAALKHTHHHVENR